MYVNKIVNIIWHIFINFVLTKLLTLFKHFFIHLLLTKLLTLFKHFLFNLIDIFKLIEIKNNNAIYNN